MPKMTFARSDKYRIRPDSVVTLGGDALGEFLFDVIIALDIQFDPGMGGNPKLKKLKDKYPEMFEIVE